MIKKGKKVDNKPLSESNVKNVSSNVAKKVISDKKSIETQNTKTEVKPINTKKAFFGRPTGGGRKKSLLFLAGAIIFSLSLVSFFVFFRDDYYADAENWPIVDTKTGLRAKPAELLIKEGKLQKPIKVVIVDLEYNQANSSFNISKVSKKNGYIKNDASSELSWRAELRDGFGSVLKETFFNRDNVYMESYDESIVNSVMNIDKSSFTLPWIEGAEKVAIFNPKGEFIQEQDIRNVKHEDNKPEFYSVTGKEIASKKKTSQFFKLDNTEKAFAASNNGLVDIVVIPQGYSAAEMYKFDQKFSVIKDAFQNVEPFKSRFSYMRFNQLKDVPDFSCKGPGISGAKSFTFMYCNWQGGNWAGFYSGAPETSIKTYLENKAVPYDRVLIIKNNDAERGGTGSFPDGGWTSIITSIDSKLVNLALHEIAHTFGAYDEYARSGNVYTQNTSLSTGVYNLNPSPNTVAANCYTGAPTGSYSYAGCGSFTNWSRTSYNSTMNNYPSTPNFNIATQKIILSYMDKLIDYISPTVSFNSTSASTIQAASSTEPRTISVNASDNTGISRVDLYIDGVLHGSDGVTPYDFFWDPSVIKSVGKGSINSNSPYAIQIAGQGNIPLGDGYVSINATVVNPSSNGNLVVYPCDETKPSTSNINYLSGENTNGVIFSRLSSSGTVCAYASSPVNLVIDVTGYYPGGTDYTGLSPAKRIIDTRINGDGINPENLVKIIQISGAFGIPSTIDSAIINIAVTGSTVAGSITVYPCEMTRPGNPNMVYGTSGATSTMAITKLSKSGTLCVYNTSATHIIIDAMGYIVSADKFVTKSNNARIATNKIIAGSTIQIPLTGTQGYITGAKGFIGILTSSGAIDGAHITIYPCGQAKPTGSTHNFTGGKTKTSLFISPVSSTGAICVYAARDVNISIDTIGYFSSAALLNTMAPNRFIDTRPGVITQNSFQSGVHTLQAKAYDLAGLSTATPLNKITF